MSRIHEVGDGDFEATVLRSDVPVLVDFSAAWCGPCRKLEPIVHEIASDYADRVRVVKVDVDRAPAIAARFAVLSVPTLLLFKGGRVEGQVVGLVSKRALAERVEKVL